MNKMIKQMENTIKVVPVLLNVSSVITYDDLHWQNLQYVLIGIFQFYWTHCLNHEITLQIISFMNTDV